MRKAAGFLTIDLGSTHLKAGIISLTGQLLAVKSVPTPQRRGEGGHVYFEPEEFWSTIVRLSVGIYTESTCQILGVCLTGMAETGLLVDTRTNKPASVLVPWFDLSGQAELAELASYCDSKERFFKTGLRPSHKYGMAKILWLQRKGLDLEHKIWLSAPDYIAWCLTGQLATDPTLAARTYAYNLSKQTWDTQFIFDCGLPEELFPVVYPSGSPVGNCLTLQSLEFLKGVPVSICGHDHVVASVGAIGLDREAVLNSVGTAEVLLGAAGYTSLTEQHYDSGLSFGPHVYPDQLCWMGGLSASGGSVEWFRGLGEPKLTYREIEEMVQSLPAGPSNIIYYPYLAGSGAPIPDPFARGAFLGLSQEHTRAHILKAMFEGVSMAMEHIRLAARQITEHSLDNILVVGGGARNHYWLQMKANIFGTSLQVVEIEEATLLGAALLAALRTDILTAADIEKIVESNPRQIIEPDPSVAKEYRWLFKGYLGLQETVRQFYYKCRERSK